MRHVSRAICNVMCHLVFVTCHLYTCHEGQKPQQQPHTLTVLSPPLSTGCWFAKTKKSNVGYCQKPEKKCVFCCSLLEIPHPTRILQSIEKQSSSTPGGLKPVWSGSHGSAVHGWALQWQTCQNCKVRHNSFKFRAVQFTNGQYSLVMDSTV